MQEACAEEQGWIWSARVGVGKRAFPPFHRSGRISPAGQPKAILHRRRRWSDVRHCASSTQKNTIKFKPKSMLRLQASSPQTPLRWPLVVKPGKWTRGREPDRQEGLGTQEWLRLIQTLPGVTPASAVSPCELKNLWLSTARTWNLLN